MADLSQDRLVRKEVALGTIREITPPNGRIGLDLAPMLEVQSDDVIFQYVTPEVEGLAPARAEDSEAEMAQKDDVSGTGRASLIDWSIKDHYTASDVSRYREYLALAELSNGTPFPLTISSMTEDFAGKMARDTRLRKKKLDNRIEWLILEGFFKGEIVYNDGKIQFNVNYGRPAGQTDVVPSNLWSAAAADPIDDALTMQETMFDTHGVRMTRGYCSSKVLRNILNSDKFAARSGLAGATGGLPIDPNYLIDGWGPKAAQAVFERATGITLTAYDGIYRTRALGSTTTVNNRFSDEDTILYLPAQEDINELDDTAIGFAKTLTSPHPEGEWASGFYEWEEATKDPWGHNVGSGVKAFPVMPHLEFTYTAKVL
jgi:hypothetical protein